MTRQTRIALIVAAACSCATADFFPTTFTYNDRNQNVAPTAPSGTPTLGGVPFVIPAAGNNMWNASFGPATLTVPTSHDNVAGVHVLINTAWGNPGLQRTDVVLTFAGGATHTFDLVNGVDIRDWRSPTFHAGTVTNPNSVEVWRGPNTVGNEMVMDKLFLPVPLALQSLDLVEVRVVDQPALNVHVALVKGLTIETIPSPGPAALVALSGLAAARRRRAS